MSNSDPKDPQTTREFIEEGMRRLVDTRTSISGSTWQHIVRFFRGDTEKARIVYMCEPPKVEVRQEDGTAALVSCLLTVRISSNIHDQENDKHDGVCADLLGVLADSSNFLATINEAMAEDYGDIFAVRYVEPEGDAETTVEGKRQITTLKTSLWLPPCEEALAYAAANPQ